MWSFLIVQTPTDDLEATDQKVFKVENENKLVKQTTIEL